MEQIPKEVMEKIENYINENIGIVFSDSDQDLKDANKIARSETKEALEYGYRLASPCALCEGKEKEIAELKNNLINYRETVFNEWTKQETLKQRISDLEAEKERIIALLERQVRQIGSSESIWPQFKTENNL